MLLAHLLEAGYAVDFASKNLKDLGMNMNRVARFVDKTPADAWIVCSASREVLQWFSEQPVPSLALFGRFTGLPIAAACPRNVPAMQTAVRRLVDLGHQRIVMMTNPERISPYPALFEQAFLDELKELGVPAGAYNLAAGDTGSRNVKSSLSSLFKLTPPTALIVTDDEHFLATYQFLSLLGLKVPEDISLISSDDSPDYFLCDPLISHFRWKPEPLVRYVNRWVDRVVRGKTDIRQKLFDGEFIEGGTIGPVSEKK
jgi:LacI family transcriptional regulator